MTTATPVDFSQWMFLSTPLDELCDIFDARLREISDMPEGFQAAVYRMVSGDLIVVVRGDGNRLESETAARAALAKWFAVDTTDWPKEYDFWESQDGDTWEKQASQAGGGR